MSDEEPAPRVAILLSGRGSNMLSLVSGMRDGSVPAEPVVVLSNVPGALGLERAAEFGIPTETVNHRDFRKRALHEARVIEVLERYKPDFVCLAGYMRLLSPLLVGHYRGRMLNVHPSLLPAFPGLHAQRQALEYGVKVAGCTVHVVDEECDHGPIVAQAAVPVLEDDTEATLSARILEQEHRIYPLALRLLCEGRVEVAGRRAHVLET